jgi:hypothetical protein
VAQRRPRGHRGDRDVDQEDPPPAAGFQQPPTQEGHDREGHPAEAGPRPDRARPVAGLEGRLDDRQYIADIEASARDALAAVNPVPFYVAAGENVWAGVKGHLDAVTERAAAPIIAKYTGVLAAADIEIFTTTTTFQIMQSLRLDRGVTVSNPVHP